MSKKAIRAFLEHKKSIDKINTLSDQSFWINHAIDLVKIYIGSDTQLYDVIFRFEFNSNYYNEDGKLRASKLMNTCVDFVKTNGVNKSGKGNFLSKMGDEAAVALFTFVCISVFGGGIFFGDYLASNRIEQEKIQLRSENERLKLQNLGLTRKHASKPVNERPSNK